MNRIDRITYQMNGYKLNVEAFSRYTMDDHLILLSKKAALGFFLKREPDLSADYSVKKILTTVPEQYDQQRG